MTGYFSEVQRAEADKRTVGCAIYFHFYFPTGTRYIWDGDGVYRRQGLTYEGLSPLLSVEGLQSDRNASAGLMTFKLSATDPAIIAATLRDVADEQFEGTEVLTYLGFHDAYTMDPLDDLSFLRRSFLNRPQLSGQGVSDREVTVTAEGHFAQRSRAVNGTLSDRDQQARFDGDKGLSLTSYIASGVKVRWPQD